MPADGPRKHRLCRAMANPGQERARGLLELPACARGARVALPIVGILPMRALTREAMRPREILAARGIL